VDLIMNKILMFLIFFTISFGTYCQVNITSEKIRGKILKIIVNNNSSDTIFICDKNNYYFLNNNNLMLKYLQRDSNFYDLTFYPPSNELTRFGFDSQSNYGTDTTIVIIKNNIYLKISRTDSSNHYLMKYSKLSKLNIIPPKKQLYWKFKLSKKDIKRQFRITFFFWIYNHENNLTMLKCISPTLP
jgi:hypothetical protein